MYSWFSLKLCLHLHGQAATASLWISEQDNICVRCWWKDTAQTNKLVLEEVLNSYFYHACTSLEEVHEKNLPATLHSAASMSSHNENIWVSVLVEGRFMQLLLYNFQNIWMGPGSESKNYTPADSMWSASPSTTKNHLQTIVSYKLKIVNSFGGMGLYLDPLFLLLFSVKPYSINSRGIQLATSQNERGDWYLQFLIFRSLIRYILTVHW